MAILTSIMWVAGFGLAFIIPTDSRYNWLPDALLLFGFWPLLFKIRAKWLWLVFGVLNFVIGCVLELIAVLPDQAFITIPNAVTVKTHLTEHHMPLVWMGIGILSFIAAACMISLHLYRWLVKRAKR
jgi:hypothetical protein